MFTIGSNVKINEELCPVEQRTNKRYQFGTLNYPAFMLEWEFEVVRLFNNEYHGDMVECRPTNVDNFKANVALKVVDLVEAVGKIDKISFELVGKINKFVNEIKTLKELETKLLIDRAVLKNQGLGIAHQKLKDNWAEIKRSRDRIVRLSNTKELVYEVKHSSGTYLLDCPEEKIGTELRKAIRNKRRDSKKLNVVTKDIGGGLTLEKLGNVMTKSGKFLELNEKYATVIIKDHKKPTTNDNYVGIEIEMLAPKSIELMQKEFIKARLHRYVNIGTDGSIRSDISGMTAMELRVCLPENLLGSHLKQITEVLRKNDCYANRSCGMHVHIDMRNRDPELCYRNFFKVQDIMLQAQPQARRTNHYCQPNKEATKKLADFSAKGDDTVRRRAINTDSYYKNDMKTIEIRIHEGATKFKDIYNWVSFLTSTASLTSDLPKVVKNINDLKEMNYLNDLVINHLNERIEEYSA